MFKYLQWNLVWSWLLCISFRVMTMKPWQQKHCKKKRQTNGPEPVVFFVKRFRFMTGLNKFFKHSVKPDLRHLSDQMRRHSSCSIALHALKMQTACSKLRIIHFSTVHCMFTAVSVGWLECRQIWSRKGMRVVVPWPWAQPPLALLLPHQTKPPS